jgi:DNA-binding MarR family transcriptional regulator
MMKKELIYNIAEDIFGITKIIYKLNQANSAVFSGENSIPEEYVVILDILENSDYALSMGEVAAYSGMSPSTLSRIIKIMEDENKFVERSFSPNDRRQTILRATPEGKKALSTLREEIIARMSAIMSEIDEEKLLIVAEAATLFKTALEKVIKKKSI